MKKIFAIGMLFFLAACSSSNHKSSYELKTDTPLNVNLRDFFVPLSKLQQPLVYVYKDTISGEITYRKFEAFPKGKDTLVNITEYNKDYKLTNISHMRFAKDSIFFVGLTECQHDKNGNLVNIETKSIEDNYACIQPANVNYATSKRVYEMQSSGIRITIEQNARIEKLSLVPANFPYSADNTIRELTTAKMVTSEGLLGKKMMMIDEIEYEVKGIGTVIDHYQPSALDKEKELKLERIISLTKYNQLASR